VLGQRGQPVTRSQRQGVGGTHTAWTIDPATPAHV